jgi:hypothetical protein
MSRVIPTSAPLAVGEPLSFQVIPAQTVEQLRQVLHLRHKAYSRHDYTAQLKSELLKPDETDLGGNSTTLVAWCKVENRLLGTVRIASNLDAPVDLPPDLPAYPCLSDAYAYFDRFAVETGPQAELVARALVKAAWLWSRGRGTRWILVLARPAAARRYMRAYGVTLQGDPAGVSMPGYHHEPYVLLGSPLGAAEARVQCDNPGFGAMVANVQPDINVLRASIPWSALET